MKRGPDVSIMLLGAAMLSLGGVDAAGQDEAPPRPEAPSGEASGELGRTGEPAVPARSGQEPGQDVPARSGQQPGPHVPARSGQQPGPHVPARSGQQPGPHVSAPLSLEQCLELARRKNLDMTIEEHKRRRARLDVASARAAFLPTLTMSYARDYELEEDSGALGLTQPTPWGASLSVTGSHSTDAAESTSSVSATLSQELLRGFGPAVGRADLSIAEQRDLAAGERFERRCQETVLNVKRQYFDIARLTATVEVRRRAVERARRLRDEAAFKRERGMITVLDYANAVIQLADREAALVSSERQLEDALDGLKELLDRPLAEHVAVEPIAIDIEQTDTGSERREIVVDEKAGTVSTVRTWRGEGGEGGIDEAPIFVPVQRNREALIEQASRARPDLAAARSELHAVRIELKRKRVQLLNQLKVSATYSAEGSGDASEDSLDMPEESWKLSVDYSWPVGRRVRRVDYEKAALDVATKEAEIRKLEVAVEKEIRGISRGLRETEKNILTYARKISAAAQALEAAKIRKESGQTTYWEVTARESDLLNAQTSFINAYLDYQKRLVELDFAVGRKSGWTEGN